MKWLKTTLTVLPLLTACGGSIVEESAAYTDETTSADQEARVRGDFSILERYAHASVVRPDGYVYYLDDKLVQVGSEQLRMLSARVFLKTPNGSGGFYMDNDSQAGWFRVLGRDYIRSHGSIDQHVTTPDHLLLAGFMENNDYRGRSFPFSMEFTKSSTGTWHLSFSSGGPAPALEADTGPGEVEVW